MLDLNFVRENLTLVEEKLRQRGMDPAAVLRDFREVDRQRRQAITEAETSKAQRNKASEEIAKLKKSGQDASAAMAQTKDLREKIQTLEKTAADLDVRLRDILAGIPNLPHASVPIGNSAEQNVEVRRWGAPPKFDFAPKPHWDLGAELGILDLERAVKLTGARFAVYWDLGAKLERALMNFMLDLHTRQHGYIEVLPPYLVNSDSMYGTGQLPKFASDLFRVPHGERNLWLVPTAEVPVTNLYRDELLDGSRLPISLTAYTPCFRSEAGSYGKDVRGIIRQHLFREISSCSNFEAFQARRANIRFSREGKAKSEFVHTLNGSGLAVGRTWVAIVETYQQADGSVLVPEVLRPYMGIDRITPRR